MRRGMLTAVTVLAAGLAASAVPATAVQSYPTLDAKRIERVLAGLGLPVGPVDGVWDEETARATCTWRELSGRAVLRSWPTVSERRALKATTALTVPNYMKYGVNIDRQCQAAYWVVKGKVQRTETRTVAVETNTAAGGTVTQTIVESTTVTRSGPVVNRVMPVSTGMRTPSGRLETVAGLHHVAWSVNRWWQSTIYPDGKMYRPFFFHDGQALHGSSSDSLVHTYPASHGCVRMLHADIDALWDAGFGAGDVVNVYGTWLD